MPVLFATLLLVGVGVATAQRALPQPVPGTTVAVVDPASRFEFSLSTRWGQRLVGQFPQAHGDVIALSDQHRQVRITLATTRVEIVDYPRYTRLMRGPRFFHAEKFPDVQFVSDPYTLQLLHEGGVLTGWLRMHGVQRRERFVFAPAACDRPGRGCDIVAQGAVSRGDYGLNGLRLALRDEVRFTLRVRLRDMGTTAGTP